MSRIETIWNKGIAALCDRRFPDEFPDGVHYKPVPRLAGALASRLAPGKLISEHNLDPAIEEGDLVWVRLSWLKSFINQVLPHVRSNFTLVTADSDSCAPSELGMLARRVIESPFITHWYTQNYDGSIRCDRISPIPIGVDFHMLSEKSIWGERLTSPLEQEKKLLSVRDSLPPLTDRTRRVYADFGWQSSRGFLHYRRYAPLKGTKFHESRYELTKLLHRNPSVYFQSGPLPRSEMWRRRGQYGFVLSPHGMGLDCHRTWEALVLGHIVLVPSSAIDPVFRGLPVIPLSDWSEVTSANLERWHDRYRTFDSRHKILTSRHWTSTMRAGAAPQYEPALHS